MRWRQLMSKYLINKNYYIRDDLRSIIIYFDYFSQGITLPTLLRAQLMKKAIHKFLRIAVIAIYFTKLYKFAYSSLRLDDNSLIIMKSRGERNNTVKLVEQDRQLLIVKKVHDKKTFLKEKRFYNKYFRNSSRIKLPKHTFHANNSIHIEFLRHKSLQRLAIDGTVNLTEALRHYQILKKELIKLYNDQSLIHGDLWLTNIVVTEENYFLIDYSESHSNNANYDLYVLLFSIFSAFQLVNNESITMNSHMKKSTVAHMLNTTVRNIRQFESQFLRYRESRFPNVLYN
jgi:tRNA A-37 threonylcarbamoyl transferase component Bud32